MKKSQRQLILQLIIYIVNKEQRTMKFLKLIKDALQKADFFTSTEYLRYKKEPQYRTVFGGFSSMVLILSLMIVFSNKVINTLNMMSITSSTSVEAVDDPTSVILSTKGEERRGFMFGVEIWHHNLNEGVRYFDINFVNTELNYGDANNETSIQYALEPCTPDHWKGYPLILEKFDSLHMDYWLCPPRDIDFEIRGKYSSSVSKTMDLSVNKCTNNSFSPLPCADDDQINQFFAEYGNKVYFTIYFINPRINPEEAEYLTYYMSDQNYIIFSQTGGEEGQIMVDDYTIETDDSISPIPLIVTDTGSIVQRTAIKNRFEIAPDNTNYCTFYFFKSSNSLQITRSYQKLDEILSYIGGLFGTIVLCLFIVRIYNGYSFQIHLGAILYKHDEEKDGFHKYNFWHFIVQGAYNFLKLFGGGGGLERAKGYQRCREELLKQLDILYLLKRVSYLERAIEVMLDDHQLKGIHLLKKPTLAQARRYRKNFKLHQRAIKVDESNQKDSSTTPQPNNSFNNLNDILAQKNNAVSNDYQVQPPFKDLQKQDHDSKSRQPHYQVNENYSDSSSDSENEGEQSISVTFKQVARLKKQKSTSSISRRIYHNLNDCVKKMVEKEEQSFEVSQMFDNVQQQVATNIKIDFDSRPKCETSRTNKAPSGTLIRPNEGAELQSDFHFVEISDN